jgi:hypothetical protein
MQEVGLPAGVASVHLSFQPEWEAGRLSHWGWGSNADTAFTTGTAAAARRVRTADFTLRQTNHVAQPQLG